ncbi:MAG: hypothetical protein ACRD4D_06720 [Candidatus Acidiferrales bacterium]
MDHVIVVYDDATVSAPVLRIKEGDTVEWRGPSGATITFKQGGCPLNNGPRYTIPAGGGTARNPVVPKPALATYKYDSQVGSKRVDPQIEII